MTSEKRIELLYPQKTILVAEDDEAGKEDDISKDEEENKEKQEPEEIVDIDRAVVPEFTNELPEKIVKPWTRPVYFDASTAMDMGCRDLTAVPFAHYDFRASQVIIED